MQRLLRIAGSFLIVLTAYSVYAITVAPFISRPAAPRPIGSEPYTGGPRHGIDHRLNAIRGIFPPGSWELDNPKILETDQVKVLIRDYQNLGDGRVELRPCTLIFLPEGTEEDEVERNRQAVILQAPQGALLQFDRPFNLGRADIGRLVAGQLRGPIVIRSQGKSPGPEDDLLIVTRDVQMNEQQVWTPHVVDFRWGPNYGRGDQMRIKLKPGDRGRGGQRGPNVGGMELFELAHVEQLHLELKSMRKAAKGAQLVAEAEKTPRTAAGAKGGLMTKEYFGPAIASRNDMPIEVTCRGPFRCDMSQQVATFEDRVTVWRINPTGQSDQLNCELLSIFFMNKPAAATGPAKPDDSKPNAANLAVQRIEARGDPVTLLAPSEKVESRGQRLEYDMQHDRITLDGQGEVFLRQDGYEIHARGVQYQSAGQGKLGIVVAGGPGWLRGRMANRTGDSKGQQMVEARWAEQLRVRPHEQNQLISLMGNAELSFADLGRLQAKEVHFWLEEIPAKDGGGKSQFRPDRMLAREDVHIDSAQLSGTVKQMEVWFEQANASEGNRWQPGSEPRTERGAGPGPELPRPRTGLQPTAARYPAPGAGGGVPTTRIVPGPVRPAAAGPNMPDIRSRTLTPGLPRNPLAMPTPPVPGGPGAGTPNFQRLPAAAPVAGASPDGKMPGSSPDGKMPGSSPDGKMPGMSPTQHFNVTGRLMRARVVTRDGQQSELAELMIEEGVRLAETQTAQPGERPLLVTGDQLHLVDAMRPYGAVTVVGQPAHFEARGLGLTGTNINLNRGTNKLWIDGAGRMDLPIDRDMEGRTLAKPAVLGVVWQERMVFDGQKARFEEAVTASTAAQGLRTETLEVKFREPIRFADSNVKQQPQAESIFCGGGVVLSNRTFDEKGQVSQDCMQVPDLAMNLLSGAVTAGGPGWLTSVRRGGGGMTLPATPRVAPRTASPEPADPSKLTCLQVRFQGGLTGNMKNRALTFRDQVKAAYAPVGDWGATLNIDQPESLGPRGVLLQCDQILVNEMGAAVGDRRAIELEAAGNTIIEGQSFTARSLRMTYAESKDLLVLEGDGRSDAELFRQQQVGGERSRVAARKILYWPSTNKLWIDGARSLELSGLPPPKK